MVMVMVMEGDRSCPCSWDVLVAGAGPAGAATAIALLRHEPSLRVLMVDRRDHADGTRVGETLPPEVRASLERLGVWGSFTGQGHRPSHGFRAAWGRRDPLERSFITNVYGHGWNVDRGRFDAMLVEEARTAGAEVRAGVPVRSIVRLDRDGARRWVVGLGGERPERIETAFVVDASGRSSGLARRLGAAPRTVDRLVGLYRWFGLDPIAASSDVPLIEACPTGWWYSAMVPGDRVVVALMTDGDLATAGELHRSHAWEQALRRAPATAARIARATPLGPPSAHPAGSQLKLPLAAPDWVAVGDAAAARDPLCGQGISLALGSALAVAPAVAACVRGDGTAALSQYAADVGHDFARYLVARRDYYRAEPRFETPFWQRRHRDIDTTERNAS